MAAAGDAVPQGCALGGGALSGGALSRGALSGGALSRGALNPTHNGILVVVDHR